VARFGGLKKLVGVNLEEIDAREINSIPLFTDSAGRDVVVRVGRYGPYLERIVDGGSQRANLPDDLPPDELTAEIAEKLFATPVEGRSLGTDPVTGHEIVAKEGRYGPYVTEVLPDPDPSKGSNKGSEKSTAKKPKPRTGSLFKSMNLETVNLDDALRLLSLPRLVGTDPETGQEITAQNGRYGPYLKRGSDSRSLTDEEQIFTVTLDEACKIYAEPKRRGRQAAAKPPLRELAPDPVTGKPMVVKEGRFGPYVTDGEGVNASLRKGDSVETLTDERAAELLADKRAKGPAPQRRSGRRTTTSA
jgi:DNA topoisomerase I